MLVAGVRWALRGKDAGSVRSGVLRARPRTPHRSAQRGPAAQSLFCQTLLVAHGGSLGLAAEISLGLLLVLVALLAWRAARDEDDDEPYGR